MKLEGKSELFRMLAPSRSDTTPTECTHDCRLPNPAGGAWFCAWCGAYPLPCFQGQEAKLTDVAAALQRAWRERDEARDEVKYLRAIFDVREVRSVREIGATHECLELRERVAFLESREVCTVAHDNVETCGYCQRDALAARLAEVTKDRDAYFADLLDKNSRLAEAEQELRGLLARVVPYLDRGMEALHRDIAAALAGEPATEPAKTADQPPTVLTNPWNGEPRDIRDVESDPTGILMVEPGKPLRAADQPNVAPSIEWRLTTEKINDLQIDSIKRLIPLCKAAHFVNVRVRINGTWEEYQADWIKHMVRIERAADPTSVSQDDYDALAARLAEVTKDRDAYFADLLDKNSRLAEAERLLRQAWTGDQLHWSTWRKWKDEVEAFLRPTVSADEVQK